MNKNHKKKVVIGTTAALAVSGVAAGTQTLKSHVPVVKDTTQTRVANAIKETTKTIDVAKAETSIIQTGTIVTEAKVVYGNKPAAKVSVTKTMYATANLNVRASASTKAKAVTTIKKNQAVTVSQTKNGWAKVKVNGKTGWASTKYLTAKKPVTSKTAKASVTKTMYTTANLNVRASASTKAKAVTTIKKSQAVTVSQTKNGWAKVKVNGKTGWVSTKYLTAKKPETSKTAYAKAKVAVKAKANAKSQTLMTVNANTAMTVYSTTSGSYVKVKVKGKTGWVPKTQVVNSITVKKTVNETIAFKTVKQNDATLPKGQTKVVQNGKNGTKSVTYQATYTNGKLVSNKAIASKVTKQPVNKIVKVGTKATVSSTKPVSKPVTREEVDKLLKAAGFGGGGDQYTLSGPNSPYRYDINGEKIYGVFPGNCYMTVFVDKGRIVAVRFEKNHYDNFKTKNGADYKKEVEKIKKGVRALADAVYGQGTQKSDQLYNLMMNSKRDSVDLDFVKKNESIEIKEMFYR